MLPVLAAFGLISFIVLARIAVHSKNDSVIFWCGVGSMFSALLAALSLAFMLST